MGENLLIQTAIQRISTLGSQVKGHVFDCPLWARVAYLFDVPEEVAREFCLLSEKDPDQCEKTQRETYVQIFEGFEDDEQ